MLGDVVVKTVPMSSFSVALIYRGNLRDSPNAHPKKIRRPCSGILNIHIFIVNPWTRPYFLGGGGLGAVPLNSHEYTSPAFRLFNLTDLRSSSLLTYYPILIYFILAGCTQKRCVERGHPPSGAWKNGSPPRCRFEISKKEIFPK